MGGQGLFVIDDPSQIDELPNASVPDSCKNCLATPFRFDQVADDIGHRVDKIIGGFNILRDGFLAFRHFSNLPKCSEGQPCRREKFVLLDAA